MSLELVEMLNIFPSQAEYILQTVSKSVVPKVKTMLQRKQQEITSTKDKISLHHMNANHSDAAADSPLSLSIGLNELVGDYGVGGSQIALTLCAHVAEENNVLWFDAEGTFHSSRLSQIASLMEIAEGRDREEVLRNVLKNTIVCREVQLSEFHQLLYSKELEKTLVDKRIVLIILDSISGIAKSEYDQIKPWQRSEVLLEVPTRLSYIAESFAIPVLAINHTINNRIGMLSCMIRCHVMQRSTFHQSQSSKSICSVLLTFRCVR
jgi:predicted ATP-dependent serine protease